MSIIEKAVERLTQENRDRIVDEAAASGGNDVAGPEQGTVDGFTGEEVRGDQFEVQIRNLNLDGIIAADAVRSRTAEEVRLIKRPLLQKAFGEGRVVAEQEMKQHANLIMVSSATAGEGKTFTSLNLAISMAMEMDRTVLLVDADVARPGLSRLLQVDDRAGLLDCLVGESLNLREVMLHTDVPKLKLVPAGNRHLRSTELLGSNAMSRLLDEIALRYSDRIVLFDSPPLLEATEASALAGQMGQIVLVVESGVTPQYMVKEAISQLDSTDNVSLVLNKAQSSPFFSGYDYGYGYGYGYGQTG